MRRGDSLTGIHRLLRRVASTYSLLDWTKSWTIACIGQFRLPILNQMFQVPDGKVHSTAEYLSIYLSILSFNLDTLLLRDGICLNGEIC